MLYGTFREKLIERVKEYGFTLSEEEIVKHFAVQQIMFEWQNKEIKKEIKKQEMKKRGV